MLKKYLTALLCAGCTATNPESAVDLAEPDLASASEVDLGKADLGKAIDLAALLHDYGSDGPDAIESFTLNARLNLNVTVYAPKSSGAHPVVLLASGLQQAGAAYAPYARRLASWGVVTVLRDDPGILSSSTGVAADVTFLVADWLPAQGVDGSSKLHDRLDLSRVGLAGHSRGGQATLLAAEGDLLGKVKAWFGLDPVDSSNGPQARTQLAGIGIPTVFLGETTNNSGNMSCAPAADNFQVLFAAAPAPSVQLDALGADHTQFQDPASCSFCNLCTPKGSTDGKIVLAYSVRYLTAFFARELLGDVNVGAAFEGAGLGADVSGGRVTMTSK